jgi:hypothetical protein
MTTYQHTSPAGIRGPLVAVNVPIDGPPLGRRRLPVKPIDQMNRDELRAEYVRRLPCCKKTSR